MILELMIMKARFFLAGMINYLTSIDIVTAIVRATVAATFAYVFGKILNPYFDEPLKKFRFMLDCTELVEKFGKEVEKLKAMEKKVQEQIGSAKENGDKLLSDVKKWVEETEKEIITGDKFVEDFKESEKAIYRCCGIVWSHWGILYSSGKEATDKTSILVRLLKDGKRFESKVSNPTPPPNRLDVYQSENFCHTTTQELALNQILTTIEDENIQIIGIYGMGGVGKTTLAMAVAARSKTDFDLVAIITVTQKADETKIEKDAEIAKKRIQEGDKVLIIIDDVWEALNLEDLGIQHGPNCKILLTSRSKDVCVDMYAQKIICVEPLTTEEAMHLFKHVVGENVVMESESNNNVAMEIVKECGGLPLIIKVAGNSLKNRDVNEWMRALTQVRKNVPVHISLSMKRAFSHLKLSYDYLEDEEVQWCFLMCSMFREDESILLEDLVFYGVGLGKFNRLDTMEDARQRVRDAVNILTSSGLLLNVDDKCKTKMHDVVRDVALLIASKGKNNLLVEAGKGLTNWLPRNTQVELHTGISLTKNKIVKLPDKQIHFRRLEAFIMDDNKFDMVNSEEFFRGMRKLKVLNLARNYIESLPQSLKLLTKLRMLNLDGNSYLVEIKILGMLKDLEILNISRTGIREIPQDIGELENLRRLEVINCRLLNYVTPGVISNLWRLEELFIELKDRVTTAEVKSLSKLTFLVLSVESYDHIPQDLDFKKLNGFFIKIGQRFRNKTPSISTSQPKLVFGESVISSSSLGWMMKLIEVTRPHIVLTCVDNLENIFPCLYREEFDRLEKIKLESCPNVSCLVEADMEVERGKKLFSELKYLTLKHLNNLEVLFNCSLDNISLTNLVKFDMVGGLFVSKKLKRLFPVSVAQGLVKLKEISISHVIYLEEVIWGEAEIVNNNDATLVEYFPSLTKISFHYLLNLERFCSGRTCIIKYPSLVDIQIEGCLSMMTWGPGTYETPKLEFFNDERLHIESNALNKAVAHMYSTTPISFAQRWYGGYRIIHYLTQR